MPAAAGLKDILPSVKKLVLGDRDVLEKGTRAFISFLRGYKEHHCKFIMRFQDLDMGAVAHTFALLQLPRMGELRNLKVEMDIVPQNEIAGIRFKDKTREKQRQMKLSQAGEEKAKKLAAFEVKKAEREKVERTRKNEQARRDKQSNRMRAKEHYAHEMEELATEARLLKKLKRGSINEQEFAAGMKAHKTGRSAQLDERPGLMESDEDDGGNSSEENFTGLHDDTKPVSAAGQHAKAMIAAKTAKQAKVEPFAEAVSTGASESTSAKSGNNKRKRKRGSKGGAKHKRKDNA